MGAEQAYLTARSEADRLQTFEEDDGNGGIIRVGTIESDSRFARRACLEGRRLDVFIQKYSSGHLRLVGHPEFPTDDLWRDILISEHRAAHGSNAYLPEEALTTDATPTWRRDRKANSIRNGSDTDMTIPPTKLTLERIVERIHAVLARRRKRIEEAAEKMHQKSRPPKKHPRPQHHRRSHPPAVTK